MRSRRVSRTCSVRATSVASAVAECHWSKGVEAVGREDRGARSEGSKGLAVLFSTGHVAAACCRLCGAAAAIAVVGRHWSKWVEASGSIDAGVAGGC